VDQGEALAVCGLNPRPAAHEPRASAERPEAVELLGRLRRDFPDWAIVAGVRGGRWAAANGKQQIWRCDGAGLLKALTEDAGNNGPSEASQV